MKKLLTIAAILFCTPFVRIMAQETFTVTIGNARYSTLYFDQPLSLQEVGDDLKAYTPTQFGNGKVTLTRVTDFIPTKTPVVLHSSKPGTYELPVTTGKGYYSNLLKGVLEDTTIPAEETVNNVAKTNMVLSVKDRVVGFYKYSEETIPIPANKCYLQVTTSILNAADGLSLEFDDVDAITQVQDDAQPQDDLWYNLQGQQVPNPTQHGICIHNGKKIIVK